MNSLTAIVSILLAGIFTNNIVFSKFLGICPTLNGSKNIKIIACMGGIVTFIMVLSTAIIFPINKYLLQKFDITYFQTILFVIIIIGLIELLNIIFKYFFKKLYPAYNKYLSSIVANSAVLGITLITTGNDIGYIEALLNSFAAGVGLLLAMIIFSSVQSRIQTANIPNFLKGLPITFITAAIISLVFLGFIGL